jgi:uncharacterized protein YjdB
LAVDYDQSAHPGTIRIPVGSGDLYQTTATSENTLFLDLPPDWTSLRLKIAAFDPMAEYQRVSLMTYQDDDNYVVVDRIMNGLPFVEFYREEGAVATGATFTQLINSGNLILRLDKDSAPNTWKGYFSTDDGVTWVSIGTQVQALNTPRLGIFVGANFAPDIITADLAWVEIIRPPVSVTISPTTATMYTNRTKQFAATVTGTANTAVTWSADGGSISDSGLFTSPSAAGTYTVTVTSQADPSKFASATVTVNPTSFVIYSDPTSLTFNDPIGTGITSKQVTVNDTTPYYPLPLPSIVTDQPWLTVTPNSGQTAPSPNRFKITVGVLPDGLDIGTYNGNVIITGGIEPNGDTVINSPFSIPVTLIIPPVSVTISPTTTSLFTNRTKQFTATVAGTANKAVTWSTDGGTISDSGLFTSPPTAGIYTVTATSQADPTKSASATVTVNPTNFVIYSSPTSVSFSAPLGIAITSKQVTVSDTTPYYPLPLPSIVSDQPWLTVTPSSGQTAPSSNPFKITVGVLLDGLGVGTYSGNIIITGGIEPNGDTVVNSPFSIPVTLNITPPVSVTISPTSVTLLSGRTRRFTATVSGTSNTGVTWSTTGGTISSSGFLTAPQTPGIYTVTATSKADPTKSASAIVTVNSPYVLYSNPTSVSFSGAAGATLATQSVIVSDTTPLSLPLPSIVTDQPWLTVTPSSGATQPSTNPFRVTIGVVTTGLAPATYNGNVIVTAGMTSGGHMVNNSPFSIPVTLTIAPPPEP